jgi:hypothetical protein
MRKRIVDSVMFNSECVPMADSGTIYWIPGTGEWCLLDVDNNGNKDWTFGSLEELVEICKDEDVQEYYEDNIADEYDEEEEEVKVEE